jgi:DNA-binding response OmpR family regulator
MKRRILLVDDEAAIRLTLKAILEMNGFDVETAESAKEAIAKLAAHVYQMVITDMSMETETAGYDVIRSARKQAYNPATAILTAYPELGSDWRHEGAQSLLVKPVGTDDLLRQLEALLIHHEDAKRKADKVSAKAAAASPETARSPQGRRRPPRRIVLRNREPSGNWAFSIPLVRGPRFFKVSFRDDATLLAKLFGLQIAGRGYTLESCGCADIPS